MLAAAQDGPVDMDSLSALEQSLATLQDLTDANPGALIFGPNSPPQTHQLDGQVRVFFTVMQERFAVVCGHVTACCAHLAGKEPPRTHQGRTQALHKQLLLEDL